MTIAPPELFLWPRPEKIKLLVAERTNSTVIVAPSGGQQCGVDCCAVETAGGAGAARAQRKQSVGGGARGPRR